MTVGGLPLHPLIVHAVVVLIPLAALGTLAVAARPAWRRTYGPLVLAVAAVGVLAVPVAVEAGEDLAQRFRTPSPALVLHIARADAVLPAAIAFVVLLAATVVLDRRATRAGAGAAAVLAAVAGIVVTVLVVLTADAGATAVWGGQTS